MSPSVPRPDSADTHRLLERVEAGDPNALRELLAAHRDGLRTYVDLQFDPALRGRVDPSDVVQETELEVVRRMPDFLARRHMPFHLWARLKARDRYRNARQFHLAARRDVRRDARVPDSSSVALANRLVASGPAPGEAAEARERAALLARAIELLDDDDREVLVLRNVQELPHAEIACLLGVSEPAARQRYGRALDRLAQRVQELEAAGPVL